VPQDLINDANNLIAYRQIIDSGEFEHTVLEPAEIQHFITTLKEAEDDLNKHNNSTEATVEHSAHPAPSTIEGTPLAMLLTAVHDLGEVVRELRGPLDRIAAAVSHIVSFALHNCFELIAQSARYEHAANSLDCRHNYQKFRINPLLFLHLLLLFVSTPPLFIILPLPLLLVNMSPHLILQFLVLLVLVSQLVRNQLCRKKQ